MHRYFIEDSAEKIYAVYQEPDLAADRNRAVLLVYPDGQEYMRSHRLYLQIAKELSRVGFHVLRFDFYGTGDSTGDHADASLACWQDNINRCAQELIDISGTQSLSIFAARLGATIASSVAISSAQLQHFIALDPVLEPSTHLEGKQDQHRDMLADLNRFQFDRSDTLANGDILGYEYSAQLCSELRGFTFNIPQNAYQQSTALLSNRECKAVDFTAHGFDHVQSLEQSNYHWDDLAALEVLLSPGRLPAQISDILT
ncbi:MAG: alpha/beta hydrolase [Pseudomonadales bacterium]